MSEKFQKYAGSASRESREKQIPNMIELGMGIVVTGSIQFGSTLLFENPGTAFLNRRETMSLKDRFNKFIDYFTGTEATNCQTPTRKQLAQPSQL